jgi:hypothetical protein
LLCKNSGSTHKKLIWKTKKRKTFTIPDHPRCCDTLSKLSLIHPSNPIFRFRNRPRHNETFATDVNVPRDNGMLCVCDIHTHRTDRMQCPSHPRETGSTKNPRIPMHYPLTVCMPPFFSVVSDFFISLAQICSLMQTIYRIMKKQTNTKKDHIIYQIVCTWNRLITVCDKSSSTLLYLFY